MICRSLARVVLPLSLLAAFGAPARAADEGAVLRARAARLAGQDQCAQALPVVRRARELAPQDAGAALLEGQCLFHERRYEEAVAPLEDATRLAPDSGEAAMLLGMARYHAGDLAGAGSALERAEALLPQSPEVALYQGLVLLEQERSEEALARLERAEALGALGIDPVAAYYSGLAQANLGNSARAEADLRRVSQLAPGTEWARRAEEALRQPAPAARLRRWLVLRAGLDYDSNVALRGHDVALPPNLSNSGDGLGWWSVEAGTELFRRGPWGGGVLGSYYGSAHFSASDFDEHVLNAAFWVDRALGERTLVRVQPEFSQWFLNYRDYLRFYGALAEVLQDWGDVGTGRFFARYSYDDYEFRDLVGPALERDGHYVLGGYEHFYSLDSETELRGGPFARYYSTQGSEYDHWGVGGYLGVRRGLPYRFVIDVSGGAGYDDYQHPSVFSPMRERHDVIGFAAVSLERPITDHVSATARWRYRNSDSNIPVFDYDRNIVGVYLTIAFGD